MDNIIKKWKKFLNESSDILPKNELEEYKKEIALFLAKQGVNPLSLEIMKDLDTGLTQFGKYTFYDKGPDEVLNINSIINKIKNKPIKEIGDILSQILDSYDDISSVGGYEEAEYLVNTIIGGFDYLPESDFDDLLESDSRFRY